MTNELIWGKISKKLQNIVAPISFNTWFKDTRLIKIEEDTAIILVPMQLHKQILKENYQNILDDCFYDVVGKKYAISFITEDEMTDFTDNIKEVDPTIIVNQPENITQPKEVININNENILNSNLQGKFSFDNFIVGDSNRFAYSSALKVAEQPGILYNPLFIYGKSGLGKTHLMHAIGNYIVKNSHLQVLYVTSDDFMNDYTRIANKTIDNPQQYAEYFKNKYRNIDVLIVDDIQFLAGADKTQTEFFHTFNTLHSSGKQIIISSDRSPDDLNKLEERLRTRFSAGLTANIYPPDFDLKCNIINNKISGQEFGKRISKDVIEFIANSCENDVRHIEGSINRLYAYIAINGQTDITVDFVNEALKDYVVKSYCNSNNITKIQKAVADYFNVHLEDLKGKKRNKGIVSQRQIAMYLCRMLTDESLLKIGLEFGGKDHTTVMHSVEKVEKDLKNNTSLKEILNQIKDKII